MAPPSSTSSSSAIAAARGVLYSITLRLLSFSLSQLTIRMIDDPRTLGYSTIQLELLCSTTILFLSREGFRLSLVRVSTTAKSENINKDEGNHDDEGMSKINNVAWLTIPFGLFLTLVSLCIHIHQCENFDSSDETMRVLQNVHDYKIAGFYYCLATIIEVLSEPSMIYCLQTFKVEIRAKAEGIASITKAFSTVLLLSYLQSDQGKSYSNRTQFIGPISAFGMAHIIYAITLTMILFLNTKGTMPKLKWPLSFHRQALNLSVTFTIQSIFKHLLTEGDRVILSSLVSSYNSGIYAMVSSYGSIVSRMLFLPLEENGRLLFSHHHSQIVSLINHQKGLNKKDDRMKVKEELSSKIDQLEKTYVVLVKLVLYVGFFFISFGTNYTKTLLQILAGSKWGSNQQASHTLAVYCSYILCMALNGMTEAFVFGVVDDRVGVGFLTIVHGLVGVVFYILAPWLVISQDSGTIGLIIANEICMLLRSLYSLDYAAAYFMEKRNIDGGRKSHVVEERDESTFITFIRVFFSPSNITKRAYSLYQLIMRIMPTIPVLCSFTLSFKLTQMSKHHYVGMEGVPLISYETALHLGIGISLVMSNFIMIWKFDTNFLQGLKLFVRSGRSEKEKLN